MKIKGKKIQSANREVIAIPRGMEDDIIFVADAIMDMTPFDTMCPVPMPPMRKIDGIDTPNLKDSAYLKKLGKHAEQRLAWMVLTSLEGTEGLEWETVDAGDRSTWHLFRAELKDSGFSAMEVNRIIAGVINVNALSEDKIDEARQRFLLSQQAQLNG